MSLAKSVFCDVRSLQAISYNMRRRMGLKDEGWLRGTWSDVDLEGKNRKQVRIEN